MFGRLFIFVVLFCQQYYFIALLLCVTVFNIRPDWFFTPSSFPCFSVLFYLIFFLFQQIKPESNKQNSRHGFWFSCIRTYIYLNSVIELFKLQFWAQHGGTSAIIMPTKHAVKQELFVNVVIFIVAHFVYI